MTQKHIWWKNQRNLLILLQWGNSDKNYYITFKQRTKKERKKKIYKENTTQTQSVPLLILLYISIPSHSYTNLYNQWATSLPLHLLYFLVTGWLMAILLTYIDFKKPETFGPLSQMWHVSIQILCATSWYMQWSEDTEPVSGVVWWTRCKRYE
jgi:hypothetical protein